MALTPRTVFRYFETDGVPASGPHKPIKAEIIQLLEQLFGTVGSGWVVEQTLAALNGVTPENESDGGVVLNDPDPTNNGYYSRDTGTWVKGRGLPDTFAKVALSGSGTAQTGAVDAGVNPADVEVFFAVVGTDNTGAMTLAIGGEAPRSVVNLAGNPLAAGEWTGVVMFFLNGAGQYQLIIDAGAAQSAALSASSAQAWSQSDDPIPPEFGGDGVDDHSAKYWAEQASQVTVPNGSITDPKLSATLKQGLVFYAANIAALEAIDGTGYKAAYLGDGGRAGLFRWDGLDLSSKVAADTEQGIYVAPVGDPTGAGGAWVRQWSGAANIMWWGASPASADNTAAYAAAVAVMEDGSELFWPAGTYVGHFSSVGKNIRLRAVPGEVTLKALDPNIAILNLRGSAYLLTTLSQNASYGDRTISLTSSADVLPGDILYMVDAKSRPGDSSPGINTETIIVERVSGSTVIPSDMVRSFQDSGTRNVYKVNPIVGVSIEGFTLDLEGNYKDGGAVAVYYGRDVRLRKNRIVNGDDGVSVSVRWSVDVDIFDTYAEAVTQEGLYGIGLINCRNFRVNKTYGRMLRHPIDLSSCYSGIIFDTTVEGSEDWSLEHLESAIVIAHNTYGGNIVVDKLRGSNIRNFGVLWAGQGVTTPVNYVARDVTIRDIEVVGAGTAAQQGYGVYIQTSWSNLIIDGVRFTTKGTAAPTDATCIVRMNGQSFGSSVIRNLRSPRVGVGLFCWLNATPASTANLGLISVENVDAGVCSYALWMRGQKHFSRKDITARSAATVLVQVDTTGGVANVTNSAIGVSSVLS